MSPFKLSIMDRYIIGELVTPFLFSVAMFSTLGVAIGTISDLGNKVAQSNLPLMSAVEIFLLKIPEYMAYALPFSVLLTTLISYSRLSKDSELIALQSCGIGLFRLISPAIVFSLVITLITFGFNELVVPQANFRATTILVEKLNETRNFSLKQDIFYPQYEEVKQENGEVKRELKSIFYAQQFNGREMQNITVIETENHQLETITVSEVGAWDSQVEKWHFSNGAIYQIKNNIAQITSNFFSSKKIDLPKTPLDLASQSRDPFEMNIKQSLQYIELLRAVGNEKDLLLFEVRTAQKVSFPFVCLIFGFTGAVMGAGFTNNKGTSFGITIILVFGYYLTSFIVGGFGLVGMLTPTMSAWIPNLIFLLIGVYFLKYN